MFSNIRVFLFGKKSLMFFKIVINAGFRAMYSVRVHVLLIKRTAAFDYVAGNSACGCNTRV